MQRQIRSFKEGPHIVVATPGRLLDHMRRKTINISDVKIIVLDEADEMQIWDSLMIFEKY